MDRFSIIQQQVFNKQVVDETSNCGQDKCVCDDNITNEKQGLKKSDLLQFLLITIAAFIGALTMNVNIPVENMLSAKRATVISCSSSSDGSDDQLPKDRNNSNTCSHQQGFLYDSNNSKRKSFKIHNC
ncbi:MAG TPA: hypothetical protein VIU35_06820 [Chitinophagaceae bacterium]